MFGKIRWYHVLAAAAFMFIFGQSLIYDLLYPPDFSSISQVSKVEESAKPEFVGSGDVAKITHDTFAAVTKDGANELTNYLLAKNIEAAERMFARGDIFFVEGGTKVTVVERSFTLALIEVNKTGQRGYIPGEYLRK